MKRRRQFEYFQEKQLQIEEEKQLQIEVMRILNTREVLKEKMEEQKYFPSSSFVEWKPKRDTEISEFLWSI